MCCIFSSWMYGRLAYELILHQNFATSMVAMTRAFLRLRDRDHLQAVSLG